ncbi:MAG: Mur ligase family protein, partial [Nanoarchaeota archaeon]|nr:Mur ligase family protein [Nanoarchaeota archaeon]
MLDWLNSLEGMPWNLSLDRITALLEKLGNPHKQFKSIHVAGTNGKGSVCAMLESILRKAGYKTGLYTSPHLRIFNERIQISGTLISDAELETLLTKIKPHYAGQTHFEVVTAAAFLYFAEQKVDIAVIETGLGGRLDATNVITPLVSVITTISLEHTDYLGNTIEKIAFEKAGIIKRGVPVVTMAQGKALAVIKKIARERKSPCLR